MTECRKENPNISSELMDDLEKNAIVTLSTTFKQKNKKTKQVITRRPKTLEAFKRKEKRWGNVILLNTQESKQTKIPRSLKNSFEINNFEEYVALDPRKLMLPNGYNLFAWVMSHFVYRSEFQDEDTPDVLKGHTTPANMQTENYWLYRTRTMCSEPTVFSKKDEQKLLSTYAIYNKADEEYLNTAFPDSGPFPECKEDYEIYKKKDFFKIIVYPIYFSLTKHSLVISAVRLLLKSNKDVCFTSNSFPSMEEMKKRYTWVLQASPRAQRHYFTTDRNSIAKAIGSFYDIDALFLFLFIAVVLEVNKEWI